VKQLDLEDLDRLPGMRLRAGQTFGFRCQPGIACFNRCCRNLTLLLYPYDVIRLRVRLDLTAMNFSTATRTWCCAVAATFRTSCCAWPKTASAPARFSPTRAAGSTPTDPTPAAPFPWSRGCCTMPQTHADETVFFFRPPDFCLGQYDTNQWTIPEWIQDQETDTYHRMTIHWAELRRLLQNDPWGAEGPMGARAKMAFMAVYNIDRFREFVFGSSFLKRFKVKPQLLARIQKDDVQLLLLGFDWIRLFLWGIRSPHLKPRRPYLCTRWGINGYTRALRNRKYGCVVGGRRNLSSCSI